MSGNLQPNKNRRLNLQQKLFCELYVAQAPFFNARKAAIKAGYSVKSKDTMLLKNANVLAYIEELRSAARIRNNITFDDIINQYAKIAFFDARMLYDEDGELLPITQLDDVTAAAINSVETTEDGRKYKISDRIAALNALRECLGFKEKERKVRRDANGNIIEVEDSESFSPDDDVDRIIFEDHSKPKED